MNRQQKRREAKRNKKIGDDFIPEKTAESEINRLIRIAFIVVFIFIALYLIIGIFITKEIVLPRGGDKSTESEITTDTSNILANSVFDKKDKEYYVYFYDFKNENKDIADIVNNKLSSSKVYNVDTAEVLNKNYVVNDNSNKNAKKLEDLKVKENTIIKIKDKEIVGYYEGLEEIKKIG